MKEKNSSFWTHLCTSLLLFTLLNSLACHAAVTIDFTTVGNPGNAPDTTSVRTDDAGDVEYIYEISVDEITMNQWKDFLNLVDPDGLNSLNLFGLNMENNAYGGQLNNDGTSQGQHYGITSGGDKPIVFVTWHMAARFCNYLTSGDTETGPYNTSGGTGPWAVDRAAALQTYPAIYVLPTLDEWYKAGYHTGTGLTGAHYDDYPNQSPSISTSDANYGNVQSGTSAVGIYNLPSSYGTNDQGGNVREWLETPFDATRYLCRGGAWSSSSDWELSATGSGYGPPTVTGPNLGFRVVRIEAPSSSTINGISMDFVPVGNAGNISDTTSVKTVDAGDVDYQFDIGKYEVTAEQWKDFLNLVDPEGTNVLSLFASNLENNTYGAQVNNDGGSTGLHYEVTSGGDKPVVFVTWHMAARFCNYLTSGDTESGAYVTSTSTGPWTVDRASAQATYPSVYVLPTLDEWYKAAYHTGGGLTGSDYWNFPNQAETITTAEANYANSMAVATSVGTYGTTSAYGTYDQAGNVREWLETLYNSTTYYAGGGSYDRPNDWELSSAGNAYGPPTVNGPNFGFRVARLMGTGSGGGGNPVGFILPQPVLQENFVEAVATTMSLPGFCSPTTDPDTGYTLTRIGGTQSEMTATFTPPAGTAWDSDHAKHWYSTMPAVNCDDSLAASNARKGITTIWDTQTKTMLGWGPAVGSTTHPEFTNTQRCILWDRNDPLKYYFCTNNRIMAVSITREPGSPPTLSTSVTQVAEFTGYDLVSFGDTKGDMSADSTRMALVGKKTGVTNALTILAFRLDTQTVESTRDIPDTWDPQDHPKRWANIGGVLIDPTGQYIVYDNYDLGIFSIPWGSLGDSQVAFTHVTTAKRHGELVVGPDGTTPYWVRNSNLKGVRAHDISQVDEEGTTIWTVAGSDGHMSGIDNWPGKFIFSRYKDGGIYLLDIGDPGKSWYLGNSRHYKYGSKGEPQTYGQQPKASISPNGRHIVFIGDNGNNNNNGAYAYAYLISLPTQ